MKRFPFYLGDETQESGDKCKYPTKSLRSAESFQFHTAAWACINIQHEKKDGNKYKLLIWEEETELRRREWTQGSSLKKKRRREMAESRLPGLRDLTLSSCHGSMEELTEHLLGRRQTDAEVGNRGVLWLDGRATFLQGPHKFSETCHFLPGSLHFLLPLLLGNRGRVHFEVENSCFQRIVVSLEQEEANGQELVKSFQNEHLAASLRHKNLILLNVWPINPGKCKHIHTLHTDSIPSFCFVYSPWRERI